MTSSLTPDIRMAPTQLWRFLGVKKDEPWVPFPAELEIINTIKLPWPGYRPDGTAYPNIYGLNCGRRFGKTETLEKLLWKAAMAPDDSFGPPTVRVTADTEEHGLKVWDRFMGHLNNTPLRALKEHYSADREKLTLKNGADIQLLSANNPQALAGDGVSTWIIDESQYLSQAAYDNMFPSISDRNGVVVMAGVSEGNGPFRSVCWRGDKSRLGEEYPEYLWLHYPTYANPYISRHIIEMAKRDMTPTKFRQLYLAEWVGELGKLFRNPENSVIRGATLQDHEYGWHFYKPPQVGNEYYGGLDLARLSDWTVYTILNRAGQVVAYDRFNIVDWETQKSRLARMSKAYNHPLTHVDSTGIGDPIVGDLARRGMNLEEYKYTGNTAKRQLIDNLVVKVESKEITFPQIGILLAELQVFEASRPKEDSVVIRYEAPRGMTDDFVNSLALAAKGLPDGGSRETHGTDEFYERSRGEWEAA